MPITLVPAQQEELLLAARTAFRNAHAPYSNFEVGAAVLTERGTMYQAATRRTPLMASPSAQSVTLFLRQSPPKEAA